VSDLQTPDRRECRRCGRTEHWDSEAETWTIPDDPDADGAVGRRHCIHEWDITGSFRPFDDA